MKDLILAVGIVTCSPAIALAEYSASPFTVAEEAPEPPPRRTTVCIASSGHGYHVEHFIGRASTRWEATRDALRRCRSQSIAPTTCRLDECR